MIFVAKKQTSPKPFFPTIAAAVDPLTKAVSIKALVCPGDGRTVGGEAKEFGHG